MKAIESLLRELAPQVLGAVMRRFRGDFAAAEDAVQEALLAASLRWAEDGLPDHPRAWLIQAATRRRTDTLRSEQARAKREAESTLHLGAMLPPPDLDMPADHDDTLLLLFMSCHPALTPPSAIALTLRAVGGLTTAEIANAFLVPEATMAQRISRAKQSIKSSGVPFELPDAQERATRLRAVLHVLYLIFNEGYTSSVGDTLQRLDLAQEAIRLTRAVHRLTPDDPEVVGLLALMLLTDARRDARSGPQGELIPLTEQDRNLWHRDLIDEGVALLGKALSYGAVGSYQLQAAVAAVHDQAATHEETDWPQILTLYGLLEQASGGNPMVALNRAVAVAMVDGPQAGLDLVDALDVPEKLAGHYRLDALRGHLFELSNEPARAIASYVTAAGKTANKAEQAYLTVRAAKLRARIG
ncbi:RNA polymerase sigma factor [Roseiterribacter gracilis]